MSVAQGASRNKERAAVLQASQGESMEPSKWGVVLRGSERALEDWTEALRPGNDPWVERVNEDVVLRSTNLDTRSSASEALEQGKSLLRVLKGAMVGNGLTANVATETVVEFGAGGQTSRHHSALVLEAVEARDKVSFILAVDGKEVPPAPPSPTQVQQWADIASRDSDLADALVFLGGGQDWFDIYKTIESLEHKLGGMHGLLSHGWAAKTRIKKMKETANWYRHRRRPTETIESPMSLAEAQELVTRLVSCAVVNAQ